MRGYPQFSFWISIALAEICFPRIVKNSTKNTSLLVSTVLNCLYPFLLYAVVAWGSVYKTHLQTLSSKQNTVLRTLFFTTPSGPYTERALPFLNLLEVLTVNNVYRSHALKFTHLWHKLLLPSLFENHFFNTPVTGMHTTQGYHRGKTSAILASRPQWIITV